MVRTPTMFRQFVLGWAMESDDLNSSHWLTVFIADLAVYDSSECHAKDHIPDLLPRLQSQNRSSIRAAGLIRLINVARMLGRESVTSRRDILDRESSVALRQRRIDLWLFPSFAALIWHENNPSGL